jgi:zinc/manganese transport system permease protein
MGIFDLMGAPFAECLMLVAIHTYLGIHVLKRHVIFVDLALAQIAALGTTVGFLFGILPESSAALLFSMAFTFVGAAVFAFTRVRGAKVPQEAVIGLVYAITCAIAVLVVQKTTGAEHLQDILVGSLLWIKWSDVGITTLAYLAIAVIHFFFRRQFFTISENPEEAYKKGLAVRGWDFLFYLTFGFVITFSTRVAGVLLVFVFLVAPAIMAFLITNRIRLQLLIGWAMGTVVTVVGLYLSYLIDLPSGPSVVAFYGLALIVGATALYLLRSPRKAHAMGVIAIGIVVVAAGGSFLYGLGRGLAATPLASSAEMEAMQADAAELLEEGAKSTDARISSKIGEISKALGSCADQKTLDQYGSFTDAAERLEFIEQEFHKGDATPPLMIVALLADPDTSPYFRTEALSLLKEAQADSFGYDPEKGPLANQKALTSICVSLRLLGDPGVYGRAHGIHSGGSR